MPARNSMDASRGWGNKGQVQQVKRMEGGSGSGYQKINDEVFEIKKRRFLLHKCVLNYMRRQNKCIFDSRPNLLCSFYFSAKTDLPL